MPVGIGANAPTAASCELLLYSGSFPPFIETSEKVNELLEQEIIKIQEVQLNNDTEDI